MESFINTVNGIVWSPALVYLCLGAGLFLSLRGGFLQLRHLKHMWQLLFQPKDNVTGVSSFQALSMTLAVSVPATLPAWQLPLRSAVPAPSSGCGWLLSSALLLLSSNPPSARFIKKKSTVNTAAALPSTLNAA